MVNVTITGHEIRVEGHAPRAANVPPGNNIVCAAISALTLTLIEGLERVAGIPVNAKVAPGNTVICWEGYNAISDALVDTYRLGLEGIQASYDNSILII